MRIPVTFITLALLTFPVTPTQAASDPQTRSPGERVLDAVNPQSADQRSDALDEEARREELRDRREYRRDRRGEIRDYRARRYDDQDRRYDDREVRRDEADRRRSLDRRRDDRLNDRPTEDPYSPND